MCKALGDVLIVGLNSDDWLRRKKGKRILPYYEREQVLLNLRVVDNVINFDDYDDSAVDAILKVKRFYPRADIIFANGGDRNIRIYLKPNYLNQILGLHLSMV
jgi:glycerol-3-phosphate cytidylyltransferase-like family protein